VLSKDFEFECQGAKALFLKEFWYEEQVSLALRNKI
jgi:hypothetical protein